MKKDENLKGLLEKPEIIKLLESKKRYTKDEIIKRILNNFAKKIKKEKKKYKSEIIEKHKLEFRIVKLPMWGGGRVCSGEDTKLWKNDKFYTLAIIDTKLKEIQGYVSLFETEIDGEKVLTVPGINPSAELLSQVKAKDIYDMLISAIKKVEAQIGAKKTYIPCIERYNIASNMEDINNILQKSNYKIVKLKKPINWNIEPAPMPFDIVYELEQETEELTKVVKLLKEVLQKVKFKGLNNKHVERITNLSRHREGKKIREAITKINKGYIDQDGLDWGDLTESMLDNIETGESVLYIARNMQREILGYAIKETNGNYIEYLKAGVMRQGVGTLILSHLIEKMGVVRLYCLWTNKIGQYFYDGMKTKHGYRILKKERGIIQQYSYVFARPNKQEFLKDLEQVLMKLFEQEKDNSRYIDVDKYKKMRCAV
ncbi:hypothetical protein ACFL5N_00020 [bacterium]